MAFVGVVILGFLLADGYDGHEHQKSQKHGQKKAGRNDPAFYTKATLIHFYDKLCRIKVLRIKLELRNTLDIP